MLTVTTVVTKYHKSLRLTDSGGSGYQVGHGVDTPRRCQRKNYEYFGRLMRGTKIGTGGEEGPVEREASGTRPREGRVRNTPDVPE